MQFFHRFLPLGCLLVGCSALGARPLQADDAKPSPIEREESWQVILMSGQRIGYSRSLIEPFERDGQQLVRSAVEMHMSIKRFGQTLRMGTMLRTEETLDGNLQRFEFEQSNPPAGTKKTVGVVDGETLRLENDVAGKITKSTRKWDAAAKSPAYQDRVLRDHPLKPGETKSFDAYLPEFGKTATVKIVAEKEESVTLLDKSKADALKVRVTQSAIPGMATIGWIDGQGETLKSSTSMLGTEMVTYTVSRDEALKSIDTAELDLAVNTLIKVDAIPGVHDQAKITYRITIPDQDPLEFLVQDDVQTVKKIDDHTAEVTIEALAIPDKVIASDLPAKEFLEPSEFLQSDHPKVKEHAKAAVQVASDPGAIARAMETYVRNKLDKKNFSTALASAAEVAENLEGDCTEHAVLLAAMLRAKMIPSRVAVGIVYVDFEKEPCFGGHMWTEAWLNGKWTPLDATMGRGGTKAGHIKLGHSSFADGDTTPIGTFAPLMLAIGGMKIEIVK